MSVLGFIWWIVRSFPYHVAMILMPLILMTAGIILKDENLIFLSLPGMILIGFLGALHIILCALWVEYKKET